MPGTEARKRAIFLLLASGRLRWARFNPDEARDPHGRWVDEGGFSESPSDALLNLERGKAATVSPEDARGVVEKASDQGAGPVDLTNLTIEGTPIFAGGLNRSRDTMPQIPREHQEQFLESLDAKGVSVSYENVRPGKLLPTQNEIDAVRVGQKLQEYDKGNKDLRAIMVSKDNYVLDGHHRWATMAIVDVESPKLKVKMPIIRLGAEHKKALKLMLDFTKKAGIVNRALEGFNEAKHPRDERGQWTDSGSSVAHSAEAVGFDKSPWDFSKFKDAPDLRSDIVSVADAKKVREELKRQGRLNDDGRTISLYHSTLSDTEPILKRGLVPGAVDAPAQDWKASHSSYSTYFHLDRTVAERDIEFGGHVIEARIPITPKTLIRFLPDEDSSPDVHAGVSTLIHGGAVAFIGGVPPSALRVISSKGTDEGSKIIRMRHNASVRYPVRQAGDSLEAKFNVALRAAFAVASKRLPNVDATIKTLEGALQRVVPALLKKGLEAGGEAAAARLKVAEFDEAKHPRDDKGQWTGSPGASFDFPQDFKLQDSQYDINTKFPLDTMVVASVDINLLHSEYGNDARVKDMTSALKQGVKFPPLTLEQRSNGKLVVLDGRTRIAALREAGIKGKVPAVIRLEDRGTESSLPKGIVIDESRTASLRKGGSSLRGAAKKPFTFTFHSDNPQAVQWAKEHATELIDEISRVTRERLKAAVVAHESGVINDKEFSNRLEDAVGNEERAQTIARTESMISVHQGQRESWDQAVEDGLLSGDEKRVWIVTPDEKLCPICDALDGVETNLDGEYPGGVEAPPAHPNCRCTEGLA